MAEKEIAIKIRVEGKELDNSANVAKLLTKNIEKLKQRLTELAKAGKTNGEEFKKLKGDLDALGGTFDETTGDLTDLTNELNKQETVVESLTNEYEDLESQMKNMGKRTVGNAADYDNLTSKMEETKLKLGEASDKVGGMSNKLKDMPGPIGDANRALTDLSGVAKSFGITLSATGIIFIIAAFAALILIVKKVYDTFPPLQDAVKALGDAFGFLMDAIQPFFDWVGDKLTKIINFFGKKIAEATGNVDEFNKKIADRAATKDAIKNSEDRIKQLEKEIITAKGINKDKLKAENDFEKAKLELNKKYQEDNKELDEDYYDEMENITLQYTQDIQDIQDTAAQVSLDKQKEANDAKLEAEKDYHNRMTELQNEQNVLFAKNEYEASKIILFQQYEAQVKEINQLEISEEKKAKLILKVRENYGAKLLKQQEEQQKERIKNDNELRLAIVNATIAGYEDDYQRSVAQLELNKILRDKEIKAIVGDEELKTKLLDLEQKKYELEYKKIIETRRAQNKQFALDEVQDLYESFQLRQDTILMAIDNSNKAEVAKIQERYDTIAEIDKVARANELVRLDAEFEDKLITEEAYLAQRDALNGYYNELELTRVRELEAEVRAQRQANIAAMNMLTSAIGDVASAMGEESKASKALIKVQQVLTAVTQTLALVEAFRGLSKDIAKGFPTNIIAVASTLALIAATFVSWKAVANKGLTTTPSGGSSSSTTQNNGKNYGEGGYIQGNSHANGGVPITAEGGEFMINKNSTQMFGSMLSMMNDMGNNKSVSMAFQDKPKDNSTIDTPIIKTYVIESELSNQQQRAARLKDISVI